MRKSSKALSLSRESLRALTPHASEALRARGLRDVAGARLQAVRGGIYASQCLCSGNYYTQ